MHGKTVLLTAACMVLANLAWGAESGSASVAASGVAPLSADKCPFRDQRATGEQADKPCPFEKRHAALRDKRETSVKKDCLEKSGTPCPLQRDARHEGGRGKCDSEK